MSLPYTLLRDIESARNLMEARRRLPRHLWAAMLAEETCLPTYRETKTGVWTAEIDGVEHPSYYELDHLASRNHRWLRAIGEARMVALADWLDNPVSRATVIRAATGAQEVDDPYAENPAKAIREKLANQGVQVGEARKAA